MVLLDFGCGVDIKMNELTKNELLEIYGLLEHHYTDPERCFNPNPQLLLKLNSMIENYCEHSFYFHFSVNGSVVRCDKCNKEISG